MMDFPLTLTHLLERASTVFPQTEIVARDASGELYRSTWGKLGARSRQLARVLEKRGVTRGTRVATLAWNHNRHLEAYFTIPAMGAVLHTLNLRLHPSDLGYIAKHADDTVVLVDSSLLPLLEGVKKLAPNIKHTIVFDQDYDALLAAEQEDYVWPTLDERDAAILCYTSGTTGNPKGVLYSHRSTTLHSLIGCMADAMGICEEDVVMPVVPMFHANAWGLPQMCALTGAKVVLPGPKLDPASLLELIVKERVTLAAGVPTIWLGILAALDANPGKWDLSSVRTTIVGGSAAPPAMIEGFKKRHGIHVTHAWGMTELNPLGTLARVKRHLRGDPAREAAFEATQGYAVPFVETRHTDDTGKVLPRDNKTMGELETRGAWVASSYYADEGADRWTKDGWFKTGDVVTICPDGYVTICDRSKDVIKSGGEWISSVELENALMAHPAVLEAAVFAGKHEKWDERPIAAVALKQGQKVTHDELLAFLAPKFAKMWLPDATVFVDQVPRTSTGKFLKTRLRELYGELLLRRD